MLIQVLVWRLLTWDACTHTSTDFVKVVVVFAINSVNVTLCSQTAAYGNWSYSIMIPTTGIIMHLWTGKQSTNRSVLAGNHPKLIHRRPEVVRIHHTHVVQICCPHQHAVVTQKPPLPLAFQPCSLVAPLHHLPCLPSDQYSSSSSIKCNDFVILGSNRNRSHSKPRTLNDYKKQNNQKLDRIWNHQVVTSQYQVHWPKFSHTVL